MLEREILGCFIKDNDLLQETKITTEYFTHDGNRKLFDKMNQLILDNKAVDRVTLIAECYELINQYGADFITELETTGNISNFESYESKFTEQYKARKSKEVTRGWLSNDGNIDDLISNLQKISELNISNEMSKNDVLQELANLPYTEVTDAGVKSLLKDFDSIIGGFQRSNSYILGARPSMGKSATMLKFMLSAIEQDVVPIIFSLEMSKESLLKRLIATLGKINLFMTRTPNELMDSKKAAWVEAVGKLHSMKFEIFDKPMQTINEIRANTRKIKRMYPDKEIIIMIDYLTLIDTTDTFQSDHAKVSNISKNLKNIAKDFDCPVITLAQLSRSLEQRQDKRPTLADLRESGSIEEDADAVIFLYRDSYYNKENDNHELELIVAKHRNGPTGATKVYYNKSTGIMGNLNAY
ncbi:MAG TPA: DnaB-like helicase C-terminal domain-containing protein [Pseudogracilibacillus sp.]|nr:DnaB-like helicase C-terminal domain-containing protein [Pseudogracilibacillus sp.]